MSDIKASVETALDKIRPQLRADGGDVELVDVEDSGRVLVKLTGDCVLVSPPLICEDKHLDELFTKIRDVLKTH